MRPCLAPLVAAALLAAGCPSDDRAPVRDPEPDPLPAAGAPTEVRWEAGRVYRYRLAWNVGSRAEIATEQVLSAPLQGRIGVEGVLELRAHGEREGRAVLSARLRDLEVHRIELGGEPLLPPGAEGRQMLEDHRAVLEVDRRGRIVHLAFDADAPPVAQHVLRAILLSLHVELDDAATEPWEVSQNALYGRERVRYEVDPGPPAALLRTHLLYETFTGVSGGGVELAPWQVRLEGGGRVRFAPEGHLESLEDEERTRTTDERPLFTSMEHLTLHLIDHATFDREADPMPGEGFVGIEPAQPSTLERATARSFAEGLTADQMAVDLLNLGRGMPLPRLSTLRMTGLVRADDDAARSLVPLFSREELGQVGRGRVTDVLASAGTPAAQAALREVLDTDVVRSVPDEHSMLLQRFSLVRHPTPESADFVWNELRRARREDDDMVERGAIYCLGSVVGHLYDDGQDALAARYERELTAGLEAANDDAHLEAHLAAFGNIGRPANLDTILSYVDHPSSTVRAQAAVSLRRYSDERARRALVELACDAVDVVARGAMRHMDGVPVTPADFERLADAMEADRIHHDAYGPLLNLIAAERGATAAKIRILEPMLERVTVPQRRADIRRMLNQLRGR